MILVWEIEWNHVNIVRTKKLFKNTKLKLLIWCSSIDWLTSNYISSARYAYSEKSHKNNKSEERKKIIYFNNTAENQKYYWWSVKKSWLDLPLQVLQYSISFPLLFFMRNSKKDSTWNGGLWCCRQIFSLDIP